MEAVNVTVGTTVQAAAIKMCHRSGHCSFVPCPDSLLLMLKGQKKSLIFKQYHHSFLAEMLAAMTTVRPTSNSQWLFACDFPPSDFFLLIKAITKMPHASLYPTVLSSNLLLSFFFFYSAQMEMIAVSSQWCLQFETPTRDIITVNYSRNHLRRFDNGAD